MKVFMPHALQSYTDCELVEADGETLNDLLLDLDRQFPGIRFRMVNEQDEIRPHIAFFVDGKKNNNLEASLAGRPEVVIMQALSGG
ncbi:MAG: MoaD/ThiS family protein [Gammaproteobacteria bacterium]|nr:MoaD/ThiS family protein [Gammaproteobacteria bacterium]